MMQDRTCRTCLRSFMGGPRAYYCPDCRIERQREADRRFKRNKRSGNIRQLGSTDKCDRCGNPYTVEGSNQQFCPDCQLAHKLEYDAARAMPKYEANKERLNPVRNERRRIGMTTCRWCGKEFPVRVGGPTACSDECRRHLHNKWQREHRKKRKSCACCGKRFEPDRSTAKYCSDRCRYRVQAADKRAARIASGLCPQCGGEWIAPEGNAKHCGRCQEYYRFRYKTKSSKE